MSVEFGIEDHTVRGRDAHVVEVTGEVDLFTAPELRQRVSAPIEAGVATVIVDLTATTFIDSSSLGVLIGAHRELEQDDRRLVVVCENPAIVKTFKITGLDGVLALVPTMADAMDEGTVDTDG